MFLETTNNLRRRVALIGSVLIVSPVVVVVLAGCLILQRMEQIASVADLPQMARSFGEADLSKLAQNLVELCRKYQQASVEAFKNGQRILKDLGVIRLDGSHMSIWHANNERTGERKSFEIPLMAVGSQSFAPVASFDQPAPAVDEITKSSGAPATIFQRLNDRGDMLRVASSVKNEQGARSINTFILADSRKGESVKILQTVLSGKTYTGREVQAGVGYLTSYQPLKNAWGNVVGMLNTVLPEEQIKTQVKTLANTNAKTTDAKAQLFILEATGQKPLEGGNLWDEKDTARQAYMQEMCSRATQLASGQLAGFRFQKATRTGTIPRTMTAQFAYVPELDWVVGYAQPETANQAGFPGASLLAWAMWALFAAGVASAGVSVQIWLRFSDDFASRLNAVLANLRKETKQLRAAAVVLTQEAEVPANTQTEPLDDLLDGLDQITFATNQLMVKAALESATSPTGGQAIADSADEIRALVQRCRQAAYKDENALDLRRQTEALIRLATGIDRSVAVVAAEVSVNDEATQ